MENEVPENWYDIGLSKVMQEIADDTDVYPAHIAAVYNWLVENGFIDYDVEKELIFDRYWGEE